MMRKLLLASLAALLAMTGGFVVRAQEAARAEIIKIDVGDFPNMHGMLDVYAADGKFVSALDATSLTVLEDGNPLPLTSLVENEVGAQIVIAINPGPAMDTRDSFGVSRYDQIVEALRLWAEARPLEPTDEMSLITTAGPILVNASASEWRNSLVSFQPDARASIPSLQSLSFALDLLEGQQDAQEGRKPSVLFLTPHLPDQTTVDELETLTQRAALLGVRVNVWLIDTDAYFAHFSANALKSLALQTGGSYFAYSGIESLPDPENYFAHLRHVYTFDYESKLSVGGVHALAMQVQRSNLSLTSENINFTLDIQPPNPLLLSPPAQIVRQAPEDDPYNTDFLLPNETTIDILIEFPDGHERSITNTALYVDDELVSEINEAPFEQFRWDISAYTSSGEHTLRVEITDSLGLTQSSIGVPVSLTVVQPPSGMLAFFGRYGSLLTIGVITLTGLLLGFILLAGGRRRVLTARSEAQKASHDPLTQPPPPPKAEKGNKNRRLPMPAAWRQTSKRVRTTAHLARLNGEGLSHIGTPIPLTGEEMTFGADPVKAAYVLDDPSISALHAILSQTEDGHFILKDQTSVAGTWINLENISREGKVLAHGDVIHFGTMRYQFMLEKAPRKGKPQVKVEK